MRRTVTPRARQQHYSKVGSGQLGSFSIAIESGVNSSAVRVRSRGVSTLRFETLTIGLTVTNSRSVARAKSLQGFSAAVDFMAKAFAAFETVEETRPHRP